MNRDPRLNSIPNKIEVTGQEGVSMKKKRITRRDFIKTTTAGALGAGLGTSIISIPQRTDAASAKKTLKILQ